MEGELLAAIDPGLTAALVAAGVSFATAVPTKLWLDRRAHEQDLETDHRKGQRKALLDLIAHYHGGLVGHATTWHFRMRNMFSYIEKGWLQVDGDYARFDYYFHSTVYRWLSFLALAQQFEAEEIFIDARYVEVHELEFVKFAKAFHWVMTDAGLFKPFEWYDRSSGKDHFTSDRLRATCEAFLVKGRLPSFRQFERDVIARDERMQELEPVFRFFDGLTRSEDRLRWDRLVCLHLLTQAFLTSFGYEWQRLSDKFIQDTVEQSRHAEILETFASLLPRLGLGQEESMKTVAARAKELALRRNQA